MGSSGRDRRSRNELYDDRVERSRACGRNSRGLTVTNLGRKVVQILLVLTHVFASL